MSFRPYMSSSCHTRLCLINLANLNRFNIDSVVKLAGNKCNNRKVRVQRFQYQLPHSCIRLILTKAQLYFHLHLVFSFELESICRLTCSDKEPELFWTVYIELKLLLVSQHLTRLINEMSDYLSMVPGNHCSLCNLSLNKIQSSGFIMSWSDKRAWTVSKTNCNLLFVLQQAKILKHIPTNRHSINLLHGLTNADHVIIMITSNVHWQLCFSYITSHKCRDTWLSWSWYHCHTVKREYQWMKFQWSKCYRAWFHNSRFKLYIQVNLNRNKTLF